MADFTTSELITKFLKEESLSAGQKTSLREDIGASSLITDPSVAYIRSDGNSATAEIGNPALPYLTAQAAWDAGARNFDLGLGSFAITHSSDVTVAPNTSLFVRGKGPGSILDITWNGIVGTEGSPGALGEPGGTGGDGTTPSALSVYSDQTVAITTAMNGANGGTGGTGGAGPDGMTISGNGGTGGNGGNAGDAFFYNARLTSYVASVGQAGAGGSAGTNSGGGSGEPGASGTAGSDSSTVSLIGGVANSVTAFSVVRVGVILDGVFTAA